MQYPAEEIVLLSPDSGKQKRNERETIPTSSNTFYNDKSKVQPRTLLKRLFIPVNRKSVYENFLLWIVLFGGVFAIIGPLALHFSYALPKVKPRTIPLYEFSEERARDYYSNLTEHGPRVINTKADYHTRQFLITEINRIVSTSRVSIRFEISLQNFSTNGIPELQNIAVRLSDFDATAWDKPCIMLSAHYDSVELSPGGSDDGSGVVILLEILSNLVNDPTIKFTQVHLIVLFTTAEEFSFAGAKAFMLEHEWKKDIRRFINIDSVGGSEKAILFRVKPSQLVVDYGRVPRPHANVIGDEVLDLTGSDTDYSVFTKNGYISGYDFAFYLDGYNYHTLIDKPSIVEDGALQHLGENTLVLTRNILLNPVSLESADTIFDQDDDFIYFDILGRYLITYRKTTSVIFQSILIGSIVLIGILLIIIDHLWYRKHALLDDFSSVYFYFEYPLAIRIIFILLFFIFYLLSSLFGIVLSMFVAFTLSIVRPLSWFGNSVLAVFLFGLPCLIGIILCEMFWAFLRRVILSKYPKKNPMEMNTIHHINRLCFNFERHWALLLVFALLMSISIWTSVRSMYIVHLWSLFICPIYLFLMIYEFCFHWMTKKYFILFHEQGWYWLFAPYIASLVPLTHTLEMTSRIIRLAIPIMGRTVFPIPIPGDIIICSIVIVPAILVFLIFIPNVQRIMHYSRTLLILIICFVIVFIIACTRQRYTSTHPKIVSILHTSTSNYKLNHPEKFPIIIPMHSHTASITMKAFDTLNLSTTLDEISTKTDYSLKNCHCKTEKECSFDDTFHRIIPFKEVEFTSVDQHKYYRFKFRHSSSYQIHAFSSVLSNVIVHNFTTVPRTETIVDIQPFSYLSSFDVMVEIQRCDLNDSPFLVSLTQKLPHIVMHGHGACRTLRDVLVLSVEL